MPRPKTRQQDKHLLWLRVRSTSTHLLQYSMHLLVLRATHTTPILSKLFTRIYCRYRNGKSQMCNSFSVKSLDYVELQHPGRMKHCTEKTSDVFARRGLEMFSAMLLCPHGPGAPSWHHKSTVPFIPQHGDKTVQMMMIPMSPSAGRVPLPPSSTVAQVMICGSQDWLATWGRHWVTTRGPVGVWLSRHRPLTMCCRAVPLGFHF